MSFGFWFISFGFSDTHWGQWQPGKKQKLAKTMASKIEKYGLNDLCLQLKREGKSGGEAAEILGKHATQQAGKQVKITATMVYDRWRAYAEDGEQITSAIVAARASVLPALDLSNIGPLFADPAGELEKLYRRALEKLDSYEAIGLVVDMKNGRAEVHLSKEWVLLVAQVTQMIKAAVDIKEKALTHERIAQILEIVREAAGQLDEPNRKRYLEYWQARLSPGQGAE